MGAKKKSRCQTGIRSDIGFLLWRQLRLRNCGSIGIRILYTEIMLFMPYAKGRYLAIKRKIPKKQGGFHSRGGKVSKDSVLRSGRRQVVGENEPRAYKRISIMESECKINMRIRNRALSVENN